MNSGKPQESEQNYAIQRLKGVLKNHPDFKASPFGEILIHYKELNGSILTYHKPDTRKTLAIECPDQYRERAPMIVKRLPPNRVKEIGCKYLSPKGSGTPPYFPPETRTAINPTTDLKGRITLPVSLEGERVLILTEGEIKAAIAAAILGVATVGFKGIQSYNICDRIKELLSKYRPDVIVINYDADALNRGNFGRLKQFHSSAINVIANIYRYYRQIDATAPEIYLNIQNPQQPYKGLDDVLQSHSGHPELAFITLKDSEYFLFAKVDPDDPCTTVDKFFNFKSKQHRAEAQAAQVIRGKWQDKSGNRLYLSDTLNAANFNLEGFFGNIWHVPTGYGKTSTTLKAAHLQKVVFFVPTRALVEQVTNDALEKHGLDAIKYNGDTTARERLGERLQNNSLPQLIVCTYASAGSLHRMLGNETQSYNLVFDEFHNTTAATSSAFQGKQINELLDSARHYKSITGLTATPLLNIHPVTKELPCIRVKVYKERTPLQVITCIDKLATAAKAVWESVKAGRRPVVLFNNKKSGLDKLTNALGDLLPSVQLFNADNKGEAEFKQLLESSELSENTKAVISTSVLKEGVNINNTGAFDVIVIGQHHPSTIRQFCSRLRCADVQCYVLLKDSDKSAPFVNDEKLNNAIKSAQAISSLINNNPPDKSLFDMRSALQFPFVRENKTGQTVPDYLGIQNDYFRQETYYLNADPQRMFNALKKYGFCQLGTYYDGEWTVPAVVNDKAEFSTDQQLEHKLLREQRKAAKAQEFKGTVETLKTTLNPSAIAKDKEDTNDFYKYFLAIRKNTNSDKKAIELLEMSEGKKSRVEQITDRLKVQRGKLQETSHQLGNAPKAILSSFSPGMKLTPDQIKQTFLDCLRTDPTIQLEPFEKAKRITGILKRLRMFFEVDKFDGERFQIKELSEIFKIE